MKAVAAISRHVAKHPEIAHLIALIRQLDAGDDRRFLMEDLTALLEDRVKWVKAKLRAKAETADREEPRRRSR